jgi:hypothetical protein
LIEVPDSKDRLADMPPDAMENQRFLDAYGEPMDYQKAGGAAGVPVIISAGADKNFGQASDNIRSDKL